MGSLAVAKRFSISKVLSAIILVGLGTSIPELFVAVSAVWSGDPDIAVGSVLGSNIVNILLIVGLSILIKPIRSHIPMKVDIVFFSISAVIPIIFTVTAGRIDPVYGYGMLGILLLYFALNIPKKTQEKNVKTVEIETWTILSTTIYCALGFVFLMLGAKVLIFGAVNIAISLGISQGIIGLSIVAIGTSLPELATSLVATKRGEGEIILGNMIGSNIFNVLLTLGFASIFKGFAITFEDFGVDGILTAMLSLAFVYFFQKRYLGRTLGLISLLLYGVYLTTLVTR